MISDEETQLISRFVEAVEASDLSPEAVAELLGRRISGPTIRRYARGDLPEKRLDPTARQAMESFLTSQNGNGDRLDPDAAMARIDAIPDPLIRVLERESLAAVLRAQGVRDVCRAALIEAEKAIDRSEFVSSDGRLVRRAARASRAARAAAREHTKQSADPSAGKERPRPEEQGGPS